MNSMRLVKMHGAHNDFVVVDAREAAVERGPELARCLCDRRGGIGADGLLVVGSSRIAQVAMRVFNADGSEAEMCGNGIRCVARYLDEAGEGAALMVETEAGVIATRVVAREPQYLVRVAMGVPRFESVALELAQARVVSLGNPHVVLLRAAGDDMDLVATAIALQRSPALPQGANVHLAVVENEHALRVRHWERGVGLTQACGTGAVACAATAIALGRARSPVDVHVPGGVLVVEWDGEGEAHLTGPAMRVFETAIDPWKL
ncbi:MAG TPA: diaminopimelate epimerase [Candidatus Dormibacteraeota bacterium]|nr:diaminopimelate epimerase [Candidatus Dormibacteraeota bacterium]